MRSRSHGACLVIDVDGMARVVTRGKRLARPHRWRKAHDLVLVTEVDLAPALDRGHAAKGLQGQVGARTRTLHLRAGLRH
eukprot:5430054-Prymnesium_polylepis.1